MNWFISVMRRGVPRQEDWLDLTLLCTGDLLFANKKRAEFRTADISSFRSVVLPIVFVIESKAKPSEKHYYFCTSLEVKDKNTLHIYGKSI